MQSYSGGAARLILDEAPPPKSAAAVQSEHLTIAELIAELASAQLSASDAEERYQRAWTAACDLNPPMPEDLRDPRYSNVSIGRLEMERRDRIRAAAEWPTKPSRTLVEAYDLWERQCDAIAEAFRVASLQEAADRALDVVVQRRVAVETFEPATVAELSMKFTALMEFSARSGDEADANLPFAVLVRDLQRLTAIEPTPKMEGQAPG